MNKHRPRQPFRFEYIKGKYGGVTKQELEDRLYDEWEREDDGGVQVCAVVWETVERDKDADGQPPCDARVLKVYES